MMKNIIELNRSGHLTERQLFVASKFAHAPQKFTLAPSLYRILHDLIINDEPLEAYEKRKGWCARSAKVLLSQLLYALQEVEGVWWSSQEPEEEVEDLREMIRYLTGDDDQALFDLIEQYDLTPMQARIFLVLHSRNGPLTKEVIMRRVYANRSEDEIPESNILNSFICNMRRKVRGDWVIRTVRGDGYVLERVREASQPKHKDPKHGQ